MNVNILYVHDYQRLLISVEPQIVMSRVFKNEVQMLER